MFFVYNIVLFLILYSIVLNLILLMKSFIYRFSTYVIYVLNLYTLNLYTQFKIQNLYTNLYTILYQSLKKRTGEHRCTRTVLATCAKANGNSMFGGIWIP